MTSALQAPVSTLRGVGPAREKALAAMGILTVGDAVRCLPRAYQNRGDIRLLRDPGLADDGLPHAFLLTVSAEPTLRRIPRGMTVLKFRAFDESGSAEITYFNQPHVADTVHTGAVFRFFGKLHAEGGSLKLSSPIREAYRGEEPLPSIVPVYPLTAGLTQTFLAKTVREALRAAGETPLEFLPSAVILGSGLCAEKFALENIHFPGSTEYLARAKKRLTFDELITVAAAMGTASGGKAQTGAAALQKTDLTRFFAALPYRLTAAQSRCVAEITADMRKNRPMNRILTGDVGSGKTVCAAAAIYLALENGLQAALMVPTEILANQHYRDLQPLFASLGYKTELLTGSLTAARKKALYGRLANAEIDLVLGTHALLTDAVTFHSLGLVVTDEQHRFGVLQRAALADKAAAVHTLVMSATPIPRTLSLIAYGDLSLSRIDELPPGRQRVETYVVNESYRRRLLAFIRKQAADGHQTYVVCPSVEETPQKKAIAENDAEEWSDIPLTAPPEEGQPPLKAAVAYAAELQAELPELRIGFVHGKLRAAEKDAVMRQFCGGELDVLVSTTVIEVGVNVPNATLMIVENAERFGLSQLHQLRGRVGRGSAKAYCILVSDAESETARRRLQVMKQTSDGYAIAEEDLAIRGPGDFLAADGAVRQSGALRLSLAADCTDPELIEQAVTAAHALLDADPTLSAPENAGLLSRVTELRLRSANTDN